ncbi:unnamed protein product [Rangifer tarandus platyrhynchus]|uniref:Uncharacterized protein n=2 Tax=Rangifer tarandus platyrhynchus TaxID=3082113 RepID=A0ABN8YYL7_RANTA|nr:unnamed protein product [Rangifer tarandus platyrhynchus]
MHLPAHLLFRYSPPQKCLSSCHFNRHSCFVGFLHHPVDDTEKQHLSSKYFAEKNCLLPGGLPYEYLVLKNFPAKTAFFNFIIHAFMPHSGFLVIYFLAHV